MLATRKPSHRLSFVLLMGATLGSCDSPRVQQLEQQRQAQWAAQQADWAARDARWAREREQQERDWAAWQEKPTAEELASADCGSPPPTGWRVALESALRAGLRDPESGVFRFAEPEKVGMKAGEGAPFEYLWKVYYEVNARNGFGGFTGFQSSAIYFSRGEWISIDDKSRRDQDWRTGRDKQ